MITIPVTSANLLNPQALIIILVIVLVIFGPSRLPQLGKSLGKTMKSIREGADGDVDDDDDEPVKATAKAKAKKAVSDNDMMDDDEE